MVQERFGPPEVLRFADVEQPVVGPDEVLIRVVAAALNPYDWHMLRGDPYLARLMGGVGVRRPKARVAGIDAAGVVEAVGAGVEGMRPGDAVLGFFPGAFAEYALGKASGVVAKPENLTFEQAAAVPMAALTALQALRVGGLTGGQRLLVNGAAGGIGTCAVQLAVARGAEVTGVCSTRNLELVRSLGAAHVIDYTAADFTAGDTRYDMVLDNVGNRPLRRVRRIVIPGGTLVLNGGGSPGRWVGAIGAILRAVALNPFVKQRLRPVLAKPNQDDMRTLAGLIEDGKLTPVLDRTYSLADTAEALHQVEQGHVRGKIVLTVP